MPTIDWNVKNAINRDVERQHLNKILADIRATVQSLEQKSTATTNTPSTANNIKDIVGQMVVNNAETGIAVTYNNLAKVLDFAVANFMLTLEGDVTGSVTLSPGANATMQVQIDPDLVGIGEAPEDNWPYWRQSGDWVEVPTNVVALTETAGAGIMVLDATDPEQPVWTPREITVAAGELTVADGDGVAADPLLGLADTAVVPGSYGDERHVATFTVDQKGRLTFAGLANVCPFDSTGVISGCALSIGSPTSTFTIASGLLLFMNYAVPGEAEQVQVAFAGASNVTIPGIATRLATYIGVDEAGTIIQSANPFTPTERRTIAAVGVVIHSNLSTVNAVNDKAATVRSGVNQLQDFMEAVGPLNYDGNVFGPDGANLSMNKSAGVIFKFGANFQTNPLDPHYVSIGATTSLTFRYRLSDGTEGSDVTLIDPLQYESSPGTLSTVPLLLTPFSVQRITIFQTGLVRVQYGQAVYGSMSAAEDAIQTDPFTTETNIAQNGITRAYLVIHRSCTNLNTASQAKFIPIGKFGAPASGGAAITAAAIIAALGYTPQPEDATLTELAANNWAANALPIGDGADSMSQVTFGANTFPARASTGNLVAKTVTDDALALLTDSIVPRLGVANTWTASPQSFAPSAASVEVQMNVASTFTADLSWMRGGVRRWQVRLNTTAESGSNAGSNLDIRNYTDAGVAALAARWNRASGVLDFASAPTVASVQLAIITSSITNGDTTHSPSGDAVFDALAGKETAGAAAAALVAAQTYTDDEIVAFEAANNGAWTPTLTNVTNVTASANAPGMWSRMGDTIHFAVRITAQAASGTAGAPVLTNIELSLPVATDLTAVRQLVANAVVGEVPYVPGQVSALAANDTMNLFWYATSTSNRAITITGSYRMVA